MSFEENTCSNKKKKQKKNRGKFRKRKYKKNKLNMKGPQQDKSYKAERSISYGDCFWNNYKKAMDWNQVHMNNYWRQEAGRLQLENQQLRRRIQTITKVNAVDQDETEDKVSMSMDSEDNGAEENGNDYRTAWRSREDMSDSLYETMTEQDEVCSSDYEVTEEFMQFIQISLQHKQDMAKINKKKKKKNKKKRNREESKGESSGVEPTSDDSSEAIEGPQTDGGVKRMVEMKQLYGGDSAKIHGMETAVHLAFIRKCDRNKPALWPVLPLCS